MSGTVLGIDGGLAKCGAVVVSGRRILAAKTISTTPVKRLLDSVTRMDDVTARAYRIAGAIEGLVLEHDVTLAAIELYRDQGATRKKFSDRWTTPYVLGIIVVRLGVMGIPVTWSDPALVSGQSGGAVLVGMWALGRRLLPGDELLQSDHERDAAVHALAAAGGLP